MSHQGFCQRRRFLGLAAAGAAVALAPGARVAEAALSGARRLSFYSLNTQESLSAVFWRDGSIVPDGLAAIDYHLRDFRTGDVRPIDPHLLDLLHRLVGVMDYEGPIHVISGYRSPKTNAMLARRSGRVAKKSYHLRGMAIDIRLPERRLAGLRDSALKLAAGGVGFYPSSNFVHVDTGPVRRW